MSGGGKFFNIIANEVVMEGTVRYFSAAKRPEDMIRAIVQGVVMNEILTRPGQRKWGRRG